MTNSQSSLVGYTPPQEPVRAGGAGRSPECQLGTPPPNRLEVLARSHGPAIEALIVDALLSACPAGSLLHEMTTYLMGTGGKRVRAVLPLMVAEALGYEPARLMAFGAACEALHNASLVHDDLQDGDTMRRQRPTVWQRFGATQAINLGDALIACALLLVQEVDCPASLREQATRRMLTEILRTAHGQVCDREFKAELRSSVREHLQMVEAKTARLFVLPIAGAALLCGSDPAIEQALSGAASHIGVLFQLQDDLLDTMADAAGSAPYQDIINGNPNTVIVHCLEHAPSQEATWLRQVLAKPRAETMSEDIAAAQALMGRTGSRAFVLSEIRRRRSAALGSPLLKRHSGLRDALASICDRCLSVLNLDREVRIDAA